jgi:hypothetical protein
MSKNTNKNKPAPVAAAARASLDWNAEVGMMEAAAKQKAGSRGNALHAVSKLVAQDAPTAAFLRECAGAAGAQAFIEQPRNVLVKLGKLAGCIVSGNPWCSAADVLPENRRKADASVVVALVGLGAGSTRQRDNVAAAMTRYPGGANAQMPAALEALRFCGVVARKEGGSKRNADYELADKARADKLLPTA